MLPPRNKTKLLKSIKHSPLVSIGLPVHNGENYLRQAIESVLNQSYTHLELIISDNGSTDATQAICNAYRKQDSRIRYYRFERNQGASKNFNKTFELSKGKYFKWLAHDDKLMPDNILRSVEILEKYADIVLCASAKMNINGQGDFIDFSNYEKLNLTQDSAIERYKSFLEYFSDSFAHCDFVMGLIRSHALSKTNLIRNFTSSDFTLLAELILKGKFFVIDEFLFQRRIHHAISTSVYNDNPGKACTIDPKVKIKHRSHAQIAKWYDPNGKVSYVPHFIWLNTILKSIDLHISSDWERRKLYYSTYRWFIRRFFKSIVKRLKFDGLKFDTPLIQFKTMKSKENESISYRT